jgi:hypothetical protein
MSTDCQAAIPVVAKTSSLDARVVKSLQSAVFRVDGVDIGK